MGSIPKSKDEFTSVSMAIEGSLLSQRSNTMALMRGEMTYKIGVTWFTDFTDLWHDLPEYFSMELVHTAVKDDDIVTVDFIT